MQKQADGSMLMKIPGIKVQLNNCHEIDGTWSFLKCSEREQQKIHAADQLIIQSAKENCDEWFGKKLSDEFLENVYCGALSDDSLSVNLTKNTQGQILTRFYNSHKESVESDAISGPYDVIVELYGISFLRKSYGPVWRILQVRERPKPVPEVPDQYMFEDDD